MQTTHLSFRARYFRVHDSYTLLPHIKYYLESLVFPEVTAHQPMKLSANGQDVGGAMLFARRIAFSGTPSSLLPLEMGECVYQMGDDAKMLRTLTAPEIVSVRKLPDDWSVRSLLERLAAMEPLPSALIDAGALVTGLTNEEVAAALRSCFSARCNGAAAADGWPSFWPSMPPLQSRNAAPYCAFASDRIVSIYWRSTHAGDGTQRARDRMLHARIRACGHARAYLPESCQRFACVNDRVDRRGVVHSVLHAHAARACGVHGRLDQAADCEGLCFS